MGIDIASKLADAIQKGGGWFLFALSLVVIGYLFGKNQALQLREVAAINAGNTATKTELDRHLATVKEMNPLVSEVLLYLRRADEDRRRNEVLALAEKGRTRSTGSRPAASGSGAGPAVASGGAPSAQGGDSSSGEAKGSLGGGAGDGSGALGKGGGGA